MMAPLSEAYIRSQDMMTWYSDTSNNDKPMLPSNRVSIVVNHMRIMFEMNKSHFEKITSGAYVFKERYSVRLRDGNDGVT